MISQFKEMIITSCSLLIIKISHFVNDRAIELDHVMFRMGILAVLRSRMMKGITVFFFANIIKI